MSNRIHQKIKHLFTSTLLIILFLTNACSTDKSDRFKNDPISSDSIYTQTDIEIELIRLINLHRIDSVKVGGLIPVLGVSKISKEHAEFMAFSDKLTHDNADKRREDAKQYLLPKRVDLSEENVGYVYDQGSITLTAKKILTRYLESDSGHREAVERKAHSHIGVGVKVAPNGKIYNCIIFLETIPSK